MARAGALRRAARRVQHGLSVVLDGVGTLLEAPSPQQDNGYDCGAFAIHAAMDLSRQLLAAPPAAGAQLPALPAEVPTDIGLQQRQRLAGILRALAADKAGQRGFSM